MIAGFTSTKGGFHLFALLCLTKCYLLVELCFDVQLIVSRIEIGNTVSVTILRCFEFSWKLQIVQIVA